MLSKIWRWFFRLVSYAAFLCLAMYAWFLIGMHQPLVRESSGWAPIKTTSPSETISRSFPDSATRFCFSRSSVGMGGRLLAYAVDGSYEDLMAFALTEFESHHKGIEVTVADDLKSPFDAEQIRFLERSYSVHLDWLVTAEHS